MSRSTAISSGALTGTTTLFTGHNFVNSVQLITDGVNAGTVTVYDNTAGSGKAVAALAGPPTGSGRDIVFNCAMRCDIGLTVVVTGTNASAIVGYGAA